MEKSVKEEALRYASMGVAVFPVKGKRPITPNGFLDATTSKSIIKAWYSGEDADDLGVAARIPDWAVVVDIDGAAGEQAIIEHMLNTPSTVVAKSGRGRHLWYLRPEGIKIARKISVLPSIDILVNGYVILPPSLHSKGVRYEWQNGGFDVSHIAEAPQWVHTISKQETAKKQGVPILDWFTKGISEGERQTSLFRYACELRNRPKTHKIEAKVLLRDLANSCGWDGDTSEIVERVWKTYDAPEDEDEANQEIKIYTLADLAAAKLPRSRKLIKDMLPSAGYTLLTSPPKKGKSLIAAKASACIATGTKFMGKDVEQSGVLYLDMEQEEEPSFERWSKILRGLGIKSWPANLHTAFTWKPMDEGGLDKIGEFLAEHPHVGLVVIDTLADLWPADEGGNSNAYHREQRVVRKFDPISKDYGVAFLVVHHDRKGQGEEDIAKRASGTYAITGKAKAIWSFQRKEKSDDAVLEVTGKNIPDEYSMGLTLNRDTLIWELSCGEN